MSVSGVLPVNKERGPTSFAIVSMVRRGTGQPKVGHAGTLDPAASGLLLVCIGQAVRVSEYLMELPKTYVAQIRLGIATDTYDAEGVPGDERQVEVSREQVEAVLGRFRGEISQVPPRFSALKVKGQPAYKAARRGEAVTLAARPARICRLDLLRFEPPLVEIEVECGKGTYVRSLAHDIGQALGCGGHLSRLERTRIGPFDLESAIASQDLPLALESGSWQEYLRPPDYGLITMPALTLDIEDEKDIRHGQAVELDGDAVAGLKELAAGLRCRAYAEDGSFVAIIVYDGGSGRWRPHKVFSPA